MRYECPRCHRKRVGIEGMKCIDCQFNINPQMYDIDPWPERQLLLLFDKNDNFVPKKMTIFH